MKRVVLLKACHAPSVPFKGAVGWDAKGPLSTAICLKSGFPIQGTKAELNPPRPEILGDRDFLLLCKAN